MAAPSNKLKSVTNIFSKRSPEPDVSLKSSTQRDLPNFEVGNLPKADLKNIIVSDALRRIIPQSVALEHSAVFFDQDDRVIKLAVGYPEKLRPNFQNALTGLGQKLGKKVEIFSAVPQEIYRIIQAIGEQNPPSVEPAVKPSQENQLLPKPATASQDSSAPTPTKPIKAAGPLPKLYIQGEIPYQVFYHIPYFFAIRHRIVCVDFVSPNNFTVAVEKTDSPETQIILQYLASHNKIKLSVFESTARQVSYLLNEYQKRQNQFQKTSQKGSAKILAKKSPFSFSFLSKFKLTKSRKPKMDIGRPNIGPQLSPTSMVARETKLAADVIQPDIQGQIISGQKEKAGVSGVLERFSSLFSAPKAVSEEVILPQFAPKAATLPTANLPTIAPINKNAPEIPTVPEKAVAPKVAEKVTIVEEKKEAADETEEPNEDVKTGEGLGKLLDKDITSLDELKNIIKKNSIPQIVAALVSYAISLNASDVHIEPFEDELLIRYRIDGQLRNIIKLPPNMHAPLISRVKILSKLKLDETRVPQDGRFDVAFLTREVDLRVSTMPAVHGEKGVLRILDKSKGIISLESLGMVGRGFDVLIASINQPYGIIMATGPTGSGKSTTLYAILARVATSTVNVITLEDPVEYEMKGINQSQINPKIGYTFADGLRSILRQDPNIIMVGEVRDSETANMATQAALTGHLVLTTLHTNDASGALPRLINMGIEPFLITSSINAIIGQRLVRKICEKCKQEITLPAGIIKEVDDELAKISASNQKDQARMIKPYKFYQGKGCDKCNNTGYSGRLGVYEILPMSSKIEELTIAHATANQMLDQAITEGMITMKQDGILKCLSGVTTLDEVLKETSSK